MLKLLATHVTQYLAVGGAGCLGAIARLAVGRLCSQLFGPVFPVGTLIINLSGSLLLGWFLTYAGGRAGLSETTRLAVATGFVGAYTTFSTFVFESDGMLRAGTGLKAIAYMAASLILGLACVRLGIWLGTERV